METDVFLNEYQKELDLKLSDKHRLNLANSNKKGEEDGKRNLPSVDDTFVTPYEHEIRNNYQAEVEELYKNGRQVLDDLKDRNYKPVSNELKELSPDKIQLLLNEAGKEKARKLEELNNNHLDTVKDIENSPHYQTSKKRFERIKNRWEEVTKKHNREELNIHFKPYWAYILLLFAIGIAEFPLNNQVFVSFRETPLLTLIMAGVLVITLPFLAHAAGKILKQAKTHKIYPFLFILLVLTVASVSYFTALLRTNYLEELGVPEEQLFLDQWTFFTIGIILFLVGTIASFFAHDDSNEFVEVYHKFHKEEEAFVKVEKEINDKRTAEKNEYDLQRKEIQNEYSEKTALFKNRIQDLNTQKIQIAGNYNKVLAFCQGMERKINSNFKEAIFNYRDTNLTFRNNHKQPKSWAETLGNLNGYFSDITELDKS
ncbi:hypothetical protein GM418_01990 [Maribellus comscasis]|uniref:Uncharacterized protein n=1 Tax=Maribellus comscasis TaxID=2681766 RepID=A0A6I6JIA8_9BACT|nr:hypothetical protein [Maribellus comscasis]QGY42466.1 hypothetical protein GM418_01990 [Maribellus comscasis]